MSPSLREIRMFVAVYEEQSFTAASVREHATQSGVSQHIRNLEDRMGVQLLDRVKGVHPTPAGVAYYRRCLEVLKVHALARRTVEEFATGLSGEIVVGLIPSMTRSILAPAFLQFNAKHPNVSLRVVEAYSDLLSNALRAGELEFAILPRTPTLAAGVRSTLFTSTPEFLVSALSTDLSNGEPVRLADVAELKLILPSAANPRRPALELYFANHGVNVVSRIEFDTLAGTLDMVSRSDWRVIFPGLMMGSDIDSGKYTINPLVDPPLHVDLYLMEPERQPMSAAAMAFLDCLRESTDTINAAVFRRIDDRARGLPR